jgi:hypothetical protein
MNERTCVLCDLCVAQCVVSVRVGTGVLTEQQGSSGAKQKAPSFSSGLVENNGRHRQLDSGAGGTREGTAGGSRMRMHLSVRFPLWCWCGLLWWLFPGGALALLG